MRTGMTMVVLSLCMLGCASGVEKMKYPSPGNGEPHAVLVLDTATSVHSTWQGSESPCLGLATTEHAGLASVYMFHTGKQEVNLKVNAPLFIQAAALHGNCVGTGKFTPRDGKTYDGTLDNACNFSVVDKATGMPPPDFEVIAQKDWAFKYSGACSGARPE